MPNDSTSAWDSLLDEGPITVPNHEGYLDRVFGADGYLARAMPGYRVRAGQIALVHAIDHAIVNRKHLLAEAGTGTGKSISYAVPAIYHAVHANETVVICTANNALSEQLVTKDLPLLQEVLPWDFSFALLKGRHHFLCSDQFLTQHRYAMSRRSLFEESLAERLGARTPEEKTQLPVVYEWAQNQFKGYDDGASGDESDLPFVPHHTVWSKFSVSSDECKRSKCDSYNVCFPRRAMAQARNSRVIVTNYHMLFSHMRILMGEKRIGEDDSDGEEEARRPQGILPFFRTLICDEMHKMPDIARDFFGFAITHGSVRRIERKVRGFDGALASELDRTATMFFSIMATLKRDKERYLARLIGPYRPSERQAWDELKRALERAQHLLAARDQHTPAGRAKEILDDLTCAFEGEESTRVFFLEEEEGSRRGVAVASKMLFPGEVLKPHLFGKTDAFDDPETIVIGTSATLSTGDGDFQYIAKELGVDTYESLVAESPFDWKNQCLFIVDKTMPEPNAKEFKDAVASHMERIVKLAGGRTLGLFTSRRNLENTYDALLVPCQRHGYRLLKQSGGRDTGVQMDRTKLIEAFKKDVTSVLLGTESFWAGIDVPGESLSVVVIDRLPFPTPDDPVMSALSERDDKWFFKYAIPRAIIQFKQGFGRLVRSAACKGVVVCLDRRLIDKKYAKSFLRSIPAAIPKTMDLDAIVDWLPPSPGVHALTEPEPEPEPMTFLDEPLGEDEIPF